MVDIPDGQIRALAEIARRERVSRSALIRDAIRELIAARRTPSRARSDAFGLWGGGEDGLAHEDRLRDEW